MLVSERVLPQPPSGSHLAALTHRSLWVRDLTRQRPFALKSFFFLTYLLLLFLQLTQLELFYCCVSFIIYSGESEGWAGGEVFFPIFFSLSIIYYCFVHFRGKKRKTGTSISPFTSLSSRTRYFGLFHLDYLVQGQLL